MANASPEVPSGGDAELAGAGTRAALGPDAEAPVPAEPLAATGAAPHGAEESPGPAAESDAQATDRAGSQADSAAAPAGQPRDEMPLEEEFQEEDEVADAPLECVQPLEELVAGEEDLAMSWYILKVQSNREDSICDGLRRRIKVAGLDAYFGEIIVPKEDVAEFKSGKRKVVKRKLYPGYIVVHMVLNEETWFLVRETPGIGDFTGSAGKPTPMLPHEVERIVRTMRPAEEGGEPVKTAIPFKQGDRVRIKEGTFGNFEGEVDVIDEANGRVTVMISIFGRSTPVELESWQIESV